MITNKALHIARTEKVHFFYGAKATSQKCNEFLEVP
jgi:hypothetical protein